MAYANWIQTNNLYILSSIGGVQKLTVKKYMDEAERQHLTSGCATNQRISWLLFLLNKMLIIPTDADYLKQVGWNMHYYSNCLLVILWCFSKYSNCVFSCDWEMMFISPLSLISHPLRNCMLFFFNFYFLRSFHSIWTV